MIQILKGLAALVVGAGFFAVKQHNTMEKLSSEVTNNLQRKNHRTYTGKYYEQSDLYNDRVWRDNKQHYYNRFYNSGNCMPSLLKVFFKDKYNKPITNKNVNEMIGDCARNPIGIANEIYSGYKTFSSVTSIYAKSAQDVARIKAEVEALKSRYGR